MSKIDESPIFIKRKIDDELSLSDLWEIIWVGKLWIFVITLAVSLIGVVYVKTLPNIYKSEGTYAPAQKDGQRSIGGQFGGLAAIAGINLGVGDSSDLDQAIALLTSWPFLENIIKENELAPYVLAVKGWNPETKKLIWDTTIYDPVTQQWLKLDGSQSSKPTSYQTYSALRDALEVKVDSSTGMVTIAIYHLSPEVTESWVNLLVEEINKHFQRRDVIESKSNIEYLTAKISETIITEMKSVFYSMIESQMQKLMLAEVGDEYLLKEVVPPKIPEAKYSPKRTLICIFFGISGVVLSVIVVLIRGLVVLNKKYLEKG